jgi:hypothetical protein
MRKASIQFGQSLGSIDQTNAMHKAKRSMAPLAGALVCAQLSAPISAFAGVYEAICNGDNRCTVTMGAGKLVLPGLAIDKDKILSWSQGGAGSKTDVGIGVASVVLFGLPGIVGFGAKKHDYQFFINHLDEQGNVQLSTIKFKNNTPANQFMMEIMGMTGLSVGEVNKTLQAQIDTLKAEAAEKKRIDNLECGVATKKYKCSWSAYLNANPSQKAWAQKYPTMAEQEKARLNAID